MKTDIAQKIYRRLQQ